MPSVDDFRYPVPVTAPDEGTQHTCTFGLAWLPILLDVVDNLQWRGQFEDPPDDMDGQVEKLLEQLVTDTEAGAVNYATSAFIYPAQTTPDGFAWTGVANSAALLAGYFQQDSPSVQDFLSFQVPLAAGDYVLSVVHLNAAAGGILTAYHNGGSLGTMDTYHSTTQLNQVNEFSFTVDSDELATFALRVTSKNASSSNYYMLIQSIIIRPDV
jgi:hypothetical protein